MEELKTKQQKIISYLTFILNDEHFALNVGEVVNILEMQKITKVPKAPHYMPGIINLRGEVLPLIDTNIKLGFGISRITNNTCILVVELISQNQKLKFGALVDSVQEVLEFEDEAILSSPSIGENYKTEIIKGVVQRDDKFIMLLNINKLLDSDEISNIKQLSKTKTA